MTFGYIVCQLISDIITAEEVSLMLCLVFKREMMSWLLDLILSDIMKTSYVLQGSILLSPGMNNILYDDFISYASFLGSKVVQSVRNTLVSLFLGSIPSNGLKMEGW